MEDTLELTASGLLKEIRLAQEKEKRWRNNAKKAVQIYRGERRVRDEQKDKPTFNIFWANVDQKRQAVYNTIPTPDVRKRIKDDDPVADAVSELLERAITYTIDCKDLDADLIDSAWDMLVPGRAVVRIKYKPEIDSYEEEGETYETVGSQEIEYETVQYDDFIVGSAKKWSDAPWIGFIHKLTRNDVKKRWPEFVDKINYETKYTEDNKEGQVETTVKEATIYELWHRETKTVYWLAKDFSEDFLEKEPDPMELRDFWPIPRPLYAIEDTTSLEPITEFSRYEILAEELEIVSTRLNMVADAIRVRGVYDSSMSEVEDVLKADGNSLIPAGNVAHLVERGGLEKAIWLLPIDMLVTVRRELQVQREVLKAEIEEITGMSDIVRGQSNPNETATAQKIKGNFASMRLEKAKQKHQKFTRDLIRLTAEVIAENYTRENLSAMTGMNFPTMEEKAFAQQQIQMLQMQQSQAPSSSPGGQPAQGQQPDPRMGQLQEVLSQPSWEDIEQVLHNDLQRDYRIDIETDSTIEAEVQKERQNMAEYLQGMGNFLQHAHQGMGTGLLSRSGARAMMKAFARKFKLGREVDDELDTEDPPQPNPEAQKAQMEMQMLQQKGQMEQQKGQMELQKMQAQSQSEQMKSQMDIQKAQADLEIDRGKLEIERQKLEMERMKLFIQQQGLEYKNEYEEAKHERDMEKLSERATDNQVEA